MKGMIIGLNLRLGLFAVKVEFKPLAREVVVVKFVEDVPYVLHRVLKTGSADEPVLVGGRISKCLDSLGLGDELGFLNRVTQSLLVKESQRGCTIAESRVARTESTGLRSLAVAKDSDATASTAPRERTGFIVKDWL